MKGLRGMNLNRRFFVLGGIMAMSGCQTAAPTHDAETVRTDRVSARRVVAYETTERPGTIIVEPSNYTLYLVQPEGKAIAYPVGVGKAGHSFNGRATIAHKAEWSRWTPTANMIAADPVGRGSLAGGVQIRSARVRSISIRMAATRFTGFMARMILPRSENPYQADAFACSTAM